MYKLIVVDDEYNIRDGIINEIPWSDIDVQVVGNAIDGIDAMEKCIKLKPDIVITDISMDNMNGLEFAEKLKEGYPEIRVIVISGYDEFLYAKKALELGVYSYVLKPIDENELMEITKKATGEIEEERKLKQTMSNLQYELKENMSLLRDKYLIDLIEGRFDTNTEALEKMDFLELNLRGPVYTCIVFWMDNYYNLYTIKEEKGMQLLILGVSKVINEIIGNVYSVLSTVYGTGNIVCVISGFQTDNKKDLHDLIQMIKKVKANIKTIFSVTVSVGIGKFYNEIVSVRRAYLEASKSLEYKAMAEIDSIIHIGDISPVNSNKSMYPIDKERLIIKSINQDNEDEVKLAIDGFFKVISSGNCTRNELRVIVMHVYSMISSEFMEAGIDIYKTFAKESSDPYAVIERSDSIEEIKNWMMNIVVGAMGVLRNERKNKVSIVIRKAQEYIEQNFSNPELTVAGISDYVYLNPDYFSKLFKRETGENYIDFLTGCRIEEAKRLLKETNIKTLDIGRAVGYPNAQYFCTLFRKSTGVTPVEFRQQKL